MKKFAALSLSLLMMISNVFADTNVSVKINDEDISFSNQAPVIVDGRTLIPLRGVFEQLGYTVDWLPETKTAVLKNDKSEISITVNADEFDINGESYALDVPAQIINGSMMLPLRAIGEASGLSVKWNNETKVVQLSSESTDGSDTDSYDDTAKNEMEDFYADSKALSSMTNGLSFLNTVMSNEIGDLWNSVDNGTLADTKAAEKARNLMDYFSLVYKNVEVWKVPDDCKTAKSSLLDCINDSEKLAEMYNSYFSNVYPDDESFYADVENAYDVHMNHISMFEYEIDKLNNQHNRVMYKYFDTDKDTEENKKSIEQFVEAMKSIDDKYVVPDYEDLYDGNEIIAENIDDNVNKILSAVEGRKSEFENIETADNCAERLELIKKTNDVLSDLAQALVNYKQNSGKTLNVYDVDVHNAICLYDYIITLAADSDMKMFYELDSKDFEFETHIDSNYKNIDFGDISQETQAFVNYYVDAYAIGGFIHENEICNSTYNIYLTVDEDATKTSRNTKLFFNDWLDDQQKILTQLVDYVVSEPLMALKSSAINYLQTDIQDTQILKQIYEKQISEEQYNSARADISDKRDSAADNFSAENDRVQSKLDDYMYDYLDFDMVRTENSEADEFGKAVLKINEKYPLIVDDYGVMELNSESYITDDFVKRFNAEAENIKANIQSREEEYKSIEVPKSCEKRMEIILAADKILVDYFENEQIITNDDFYKISFSTSMDNTSTCFNDLIYIATNGAVNDTDEY